MDPPLFRQFEFVGLAIYRVQNSKMPKKLRLQLPITFSFDIFAVQPNLLAQSITSRLSFFIMNSFLQFLGILQVLSACSYEIIKFLGQLIRCFGFGARVNILFIGNAWVVPAVELEKRVPHASVFCVIISVFRHGQESHPVVLFVINKDSKVSFYCTVLLLSLVVGLRVKGSREPPFDAQKVVQGGLELGHEY